VDVDGALAAYTRECSLNSGDGCWKEATLAGAKTARVVEPKRVRLALLRARVLYEEACNPEYEPISCKRAGDLYAGRNGLDADPERSAQLHRLSVQGLESECSTETDACRELIDLYERGLGGLERDDNKLRELRDDFCSRTIECLGTGNEASEPEVPSDTE
jgi:TPR repeat protein